MAALDMVSGCEHWYFDPDPFTDAEFDMKQVLYRDLSDDEKDAYFDGNASIPGLMEVGFHGFDKDLDADQYDLFSVLMHEMGHAIGVNYSWSEDYDLEPWLLGNRGGAQVVSDHNHIADLYGLMYYQSAPQTRTLPSQADLFALVDDEDWTSIHLQRVDFIKDALPGTPDDWFDPYAWTGGQVPDSTMKVYVRRGGTVPVALDAEAKHLQIGDPLDEKNDFGTSVLEVSGSLDTHSVTVEGRGDLRLDGGEVDGETYTILGKLSGHGDVVAKHVDLRGVAEATGGFNAPLRFIVDQDAGIDGQYLDLDGKDDPATAELHAEKGDLEVVWQGAASVPCRDPSAPETIAVVQGCNTEELLDPYDGLVAIGPNHHLRLSRDWATGLGGWLQLLGESGKPATITVDAPGALYLGGPLTVEGVGVIEADTYLVKRDIDLGAKPFALAMIGDTTLIATAITANAGQVDMLGEIDVRGWAKINFYGKDTGFGWDGDGSTVTNVAPGEGFDINASRISLGVDPGEYRGTLSNAGYTNVNYREATYGFPKTWALSGHIDLAAGGLLTGSPLDIRPSGVIAGTGSVKIDTVVNDGVVNPRDWDGVGLISVDGTFTQTQSGEIRVTLDDKGYTAFAATVLYAGGTLTVEASPNWKPEAGAQFMVVKAGELFNTFDTIDLPPLPDPFHWQVDTVQQPRGVLITVVDKKG